jgi:TM2 domain-containing membrane protein YozV
MNMSQRSEFFNRLKSYVTQDFQGPLLTKCQRWGAATLAMAVALAFVVFGAHFMATKQFFAACQASFCMFWMSLGCGIIVSVFGIMVWLSKWEVDPAGNP